MILVVDASVAFKWGVREEDTASAMEIVDQGELIAPDIVVAELANAIWAKWRRGQLAADQRPVALAASLSGYFERIPSDALVERALQIACEFEHPVYDCLYLALAEARSAPFVTADRRLIARLKDRGWKGELRALGA